MLPYKVTEKYDLLVTALEEASVNADCGMVELAKPVQGCFKQVSAAKVSFECILHLKDWKWKGVSKSTKERVNILVHAKESIRKRDHALLSSTVCVNYFVSEAGAGRLLQAFHYDYNPCQRDHAMFHMQMTNRCIAVDGPAIESLKLEFSLPNEAAAIVVRSARVPTCDMTLASVLLCLAADHVGGAHFSEFFSRACDLQTEMPHPLIGKLRKSLGATPANLHSSHWFQHLR